MNVNEILSMYTKGEKTVDEANKLLKAAGCGFHLDPHKNDLTPAEIMGTNVSDIPAEVNGWGLLDTGTGSFDKVHVVGGMLENADCGDMTAFVFIGGRTYNVEGDVLSL